MNFTGNVVRVMFGIIGTLVLLHIALWLSAFAITSGILAAKYNFEKWRQHGFTRVTDRDHKD